MANPLGINSKRMADEIASRSIRGSLTLEEERERLRELLEVCRQLKLHDLRKPNGMTMRQHLDIKRKFQDAIRSCEPIE